MSDILDKARLSLTSDNFMVVDVGTYGMKVILVKRKNNNFYLKKAFTITEMAKYFNGPEMFNVNGIAESLLQIAQIEKIRVKKMILTFSSSKLQTKIISIPEIPEKELRTFVELEYQKQFPSFNKITDVLDYMPIGKYRKEGNSQNQLSILMSLFPAGDAARVIKEFQNKKLYVDALDVDTHAISNIGKLYNNKEEGDIVVFDVGYQTSQMVFLRNGIAVFSRNLAFGVNPIVRAIQSQEDLSIKDAEAILESNGLRLRNDITKGSQTIFAEDFNETIENSLTNALNEAYRSFQFVNSTYGLNVSKVLLTGGFSSLNYSKELCQKILELDVDTWRIDRDETINFGEGLKLHNVTGKTLDGSYANNIGLTIRGNID